MHYNHLGWEGTEHIAKACAHHKTLTNLDLGDNGMDEMGARHIAAMLATNTSITRLECVFPFPVHPASHGTPHRIHTLPYTTLYVILQCSVPANIPCHSPYLIPYRMPWPTLPYHPNRALPYHATLPTASPTTPVTAHSLTPQYHTTHSPTSPHRHPQPHPTTPHTSNSLTPPYHTAHSLSKNEGLVDNAETKMWFQQEVIDLLIGWLIG